MSKNTVLKPLLFLIVSFTMQSQNLRISKIIADKTTKLPLENVTVFNDSDNSTTNAEGKFVFVSDKNEINLNLLGYNEIKTTFDKLKTAKDTIFMELKITQLEEVLVSNAGWYMKKVFDKYYENMAPNYTVNFFLRNVLKKDNDVVKLQDVYGKKNRNASQKDAISIEILNMRKVSLFEKKDRVEVKLPNFNELSGFPFPAIDKCTFTEIAYNDNDYKKIIFEANEKDKLGQIEKGYFIIHRKDYAIIEFKVTFFDNPSTVPYKKLMLSSQQIRTTKYISFVQNAKDVASNKYYPSNVKLEAQVEVLADKKIEKTFYYNLIMDFFVTNSLTSEKINSNFAVDKDIFKAKFPYSDNFWKHQNQLPLTKELETFLKNVSEKKDKTKEFEIIGNF
jgi:hypothetical protein